MHLIRLTGMATLVALMLSCNTQTESTAPDISDSIDTALPDTQKLVENNPYYEVTDRSPMDMVYYPLEYPKLKMANGKVVAKPLIRVIYSRPHLSRRRFVDILSYDRPWRLGANESTEIEFFRDVRIDGKLLPQGRYILYCIPRENEWTIAINSNTDTWGLQQDSARDVQRVVVPVSHENPRLEYFTITFEKRDAGANLVMAWDDVIAKMPIAWQ